MQVPKPCVGVVCWKGEQVLLIRRGRAPRLGRWSIPGGKVEYGESLIEAAHRELHEETGISASISELIYVYEIIEPGFHYVLIDYHAEWVAGEAVAADDADEACFLSFEEVMHRVVEDDLKDVLRRSYALRQSSIL